MIIIKTTNAIFAYFEGRKKMQKYEVKDHEPSYLPDGKKWKLVWSDEFDGTELDTTKWDYRLAMMGKRHITWDDEGVKLDGNSNAVFSIYEKDGKICSSQLETGHNYMDGPVGDGYTFDGGLKWPIGKLRPHKFLKKYGYFECRCKLQQKRGWWSAFWLQSPVIGCSLDAGVAGIENDILESFEPAKAIFHSNHVHGYGDDHIQIKAGVGREYDEKEADEFHTYAVHWSPEGYTYYIDGVEDGHIDAPVSHTPQFVMLSTEVNGYRSAEHAPTAEAIQTAKEGDVFLVDYVRVFDEVE